MRETLAVAIGRRIARLDCGAHAEDHGLGRFKLVGVAFQADERLDPRMQFRGIEGLDEKIVAAGLDPVQPVAAIRLRRDNHDRNKARYTLTLQLAAKLETVTARCHEVDEHEIGCVMHARLQRSGHGGYHGHLMPFAGEQTPQKSCARLIIVRDQDVSRSVHGEPGLQNKGR
jgi:hypothetical protein